MGREKNYLEDFGVQVRGKIYKNSSHSTRMP